MVDFVHRYPRELSGGQQQRVAIARAIAIRPQVLLLDEPLSALDAQIRRNMLEELARLHRELPSLTILYVTHDQMEALTLADRIAILRNGRLVALGPSQTLYRAPPNRFTAEFLGRANLVPVRIERITAGARYAQVRFGESLLWVQRPSDMAEGDACLLCIRPHDLALEPTREMANSLAGTVRSVVWQGDQHSISLGVQDAELRLVTVPVHAPPELGKPLRVHFNAGSATLIPDDADSRR
jgi:2-aminoethylphosphonate transport system ATP-binding protein